MLVAWTLSALNNCRSFSCSNVKIFEL